MVSSPSPDARHPIHVFNHDSVSAIASIALHGAVLGLLLPGLSGFSREVVPDDSQNTGNVPVIELSPAEQSRLPDQSPTLSPDSLLSPSDGLNGTDSSPFSNSLPNTASLPSFSREIVPLPPPPSLPPLSFNNSYAYRLPITTAPRPALPPLSAIRSLPSPPPSALRPPTALPSYPPNASAPDRPQFDAPRTPIDPRELINGRGLQNSPNPEQVAVNSETPNPPAAEEDIRYQGENTSDDEANRNDIRWIAKAGSLAPKTMEVAGNYPAAACPSQVQGTAVLGVGADERGQVTAEPYLIKSSGYPILNRQALQQLKDKTFPDPGAYRVTVNFAPNGKVCPSVATGSPPSPARVPKPATPDAAATSSPPKPAPSPDSRSPVRARREPPTVQPEAVPRTQDPAKKIAPSLPPLEPRRDPTDINSPPAAQDNVLKQPAPMEEAKTPSPLPAAIRPSVNPAIGNSLPPFSGKKIVPSSPPVDEETAR